MIQSSNSPPFRKSPVSAAFLGGVTLVVCLWYAFLCFMHYLGQRPLWLDEYNVFRSVKDFVPTQFFTQKLAGGQIFPKLYLFLIQRVAQPLHLHILSLRLLPLVSMLAAFVIWLKIARYEFRENLSFLTYALSWAGSALLVYYSAELKQYSMDVFISGIFTLFMYRAADLKQNNKKLYLFSVTFLPVLAVLSYPAFLFFVFILYRIMTTQDKDGYWRLCTAGFALGVIASISFVYYFDIRLARADATSQGFSDYAVSFVSIGKFFESVWDGTTNLFCRFFAERPRIFKQLAMPFGIFGFGYMLYAFFKNWKWDENRFASMRTMALVIYGELFVLGVLQKYPFSVPRTSLFFCPFVLFLIIEAITTFKKLNRNLYVLINGAYILFLIVVSLGIGQVVMSGNFGVTPQIW